MAKSTDDRDGRMAAPGSTRDPVDRLLDRLRPPPPSTALRSRLHQADLATRSAARSRGPTASGILATPLRPWAMGAAAAVAVVMTAYVTAGDRYAPQAPATAQAVSSIVPQFGVVHPSEATATTGEADDSDDDVYAFQDVDAEFDISLN